MSIETTPYGFVDRSSPFRGGATSNGNGRAHPYSRAPSPAKQPKSRSASPSKSKQPFHSHQSTLPTLAGVNRSDRAQHRANSKSNGINNGHHGQKHNPGVTLDIALDSDSEPPPTIPILKGSMPSQLDPTQSSRILRDPHSCLSFASFDPLTANPAARDIGGVGDDKDRGGRVPPKRIVVEVFSNGAATWRFVPKAKYDEGVLDEGSWPRLVEVCGQVVLCEQDQWDIYKLDPNYICYVRTAPATSIITRNDASASTSTFTSTHSNSIPNVPPISQTANLPSKTTSSKGFTRHSGRRRRQSLSSTSQSSSPERGAPPRKKPSRRPKDVIDRFTSCEDGEDAEYRKKEEEDNEEDEVEEMVVDGVDEVRRSLKRRGKTINGKESFGIGPRVVPQQRARRKVERLQEHSQQSQARYHQQYGFDATSSPPKSKSKTRVETVNSILDSDIEIINPEKRAKAGRRRERTGGFISPVHTPTKSKRKPVGDMPSTPPIRDTPLYSERRTPSASSFAQLNSYNNTHSRTRGESQDGADGIDGATKRARTLSPKTAQKELYKKRLAKEKVKYKKRMQDIQYRHEEKAEKLVNEIIEEASRTIPNGGPFYEMGNAFEYPDVPNPNAHPFGMPNPAPNEFGHSTPFFPPTFVDGTTTPAFQPPPYAYSKTDDIMDASMASMDGPWSPTQSQQGDDQTTTDTQTQSQTQMSSEQNPEPRAPKQEASSDEGGNGGNVEAEAESARLKAIEESRRKIAELEQDRHLWEQAAQQRQREEERRKAEEAEREREEQLRREWEKKEHKRQQKEAAEQERAIEWERIQREKRKAEEMERERIARERKVQEERERHSRERAARQQRWNTGPWTTTRAYERYRLLCESFDTTKFGPDTPLTMDAIPWPVLDHPDRIVVESIDWQAVEKFFDAVKTHLRLQDYKLLVEKSHKRFHPDRWRSRSLLKSVEDEEERGYMEVAANTVAQALTPIWLATRSR